MQSTFRPHETLTAHVLRGALNAVRARDGVWRNSLSRPPFPPEEVPIRSFSWVMVGSEVVDRARSSAANGSSCLTAG